jgi:diguanylate cyclase (GGDEF)-like protein
MDADSRKPEFAEAAASEALRPLETHPPRYPYLVAGIGIFTAAVVDHTTGPVLSAAFLYVPSIALLGWLLGRRAGLAAAGAATLAALLADWPAERVDGGVIVTTLWNGAATGLLFAAIGLLAGEVRAHRDRLLHAAHSDPLTGLHNRSSLLVALENELARAERFGGETGLVCVAIDGFKKVNDEHGNAAGDLVLKAIAAELGELIRRTDLVARIGGDEFAVLLTNTGPEATGAVAAKIGEALNAWAVTHGHGIGFSLGWANAALSGTTAEQLLSRACATLDEKKRAARGRRAGAGTLTGDAAPA